MCVCGLDLTSRFHNCFINTRSASIVSVRLDNHSYLQMKWLEFQGQRNNLDGDDNLVRLTMFDAREMVSLRSV